MRSSRRPTAPAGNCRGSDSGSVHPSACIRGGRPPSDALPFSLPSAPTRRRGRRRPGTARGRGRRRAEPARRRRRWRRRREMARWRRGRGRRRRHVRVVVHDRRRWRRRRRHRRAEKGGGHAGCDSARYRVAAVVMVVFRLCGGAQRRRREDCEHCLVHCVPSFLSSCRFASASCFSGLFQPSRPFGGHESIGGIVGGI